MRVGIETLEFVTLVVAIRAKEKIVTVFAHPTFLQDLAFAVEAFVFFAVLDLRFEDDFKLVVGLVSAHEGAEGRRRALKVAFLA